MENGAQANPGKIEMFALIRDANGKPKIDDPTNIPKPIWDLLTTEEQEEITNGQ